LAALALVVILAIDHGQASVRPFGYYGIPERTDTQLFSLCHSERSEESILSLSICCLALRRRFFVITQNDKKVSTKR